jgi:hypothetical protein
MRVPSWWGRTGLGLVLVVAGCGGGSADSTKADAGGSLRSSDPGQPVGEVVVGEDRAWLISNPGDRYSDLDVWRLDLETATPERVRTVSALLGASSRATSNGLDIAGWRCAEGEMPRCATSIVELVRLDSSGEVVDQITLVERPGPLGSGEGATIVGATGRSTWVAADGSVVEVADSGEVLSTVPTSHGEECVIEDRLYGLVDPNRTAPALDGVTFSVVEHAEGWRPVSGGGFDDPSRSEPLLGFCGSGRFEVMTPAGDLVATWRPGDGWARRGAIDELVDAAEGRSVRGGFVRLRDGTVLERTGDGTYEPTPLRLPTSSTFDPAGGPVAMSADSSEHLVAACVTWPESVESATTSCDVSRR